MNIQYIVVAKQPVPGQVKTRLCPPCSPQQAARIAAAALADTIDVVSAAPATRRVLLLDGESPRPPGWTVIAQRGIGLGERLANGYRDANSAGVPAILIGMDTPQVTAGLLDDANVELSSADAVLGMAEDGGWWLLGLNDPRHAAVLSTVPMSRQDTGELTLKALTAQGLTVARCPMLRDIDTVDDLRYVAKQCPESRFAAMVKTLELW